MIVFPAIDLIAGKVVRLEQGRRDHMVVYSEDPVAVAQSFADQGAAWVHVVDLSATFGEDDEARAANDEAIRNICQLDCIQVDVGGGVRSLDRLAALVEMGCKRVSMGTVLVRNPELAQTAAQRYPDNVVADIAVADGLVRIDGWRDNTAISATELIRDLSHMGFRHLVYTDVRRDGMQTGIDVDMYRTAAHTAGFPVVASGGISGIDDIYALAEAGSEVVEGAIVGRAIYEGTLNLAEALKAAQTDRRKI